MSASLPPELRALVLERASRMPSPDAAATKRMRATVGAASVLVAIALLLAFPVRLGRRPFAFVALTAAGWIAVALAASVTGGARGKTMLGLARSLLVFVALAAGPTMFAWAMGWTFGWPDLRDASGSLHVHIKCFLTTGLLSLGPVVALSSLRRGSDPVHPVATGAAIGAAAGAWGGVLIDLHCPLSGPVHVALGHVLPVVIYAWIGALVGNRLFGVRAATEK